MIHCEIIFWTEDIKDLDVVLPFPPREGEVIHFPMGTVKYSNGNKYEENRFKIRLIEWVFSNISLVPGFKFDKVRVYVEQP